jgi:hypothetical protein
MRLDLETPGNQDAGPAYVLLVGFPSLPQGLERLSGSGVALHPCDEAAALDLLAEDRVAVLCLGERLGGESALRFLEDALAKVPGERPLLLVLAAGPDLEMFSILPQDGPLFFLCRAPIPDSDLILLLESAVESWRERGAEPWKAGKGRFLRDAFERLDLQEDLATAGELTEEILRDLTGADRAYCLFLHAGEDVLWSGGPSSLRRRRESPAVGLVSFVARTGCALRIETAGEDPRWDPAADDPAGRGAERMLIVPVRGVEQRVAAVLAAVREPGQPPFGGAELASALDLARHAEPSFGRLALRERLDAADSGEEDLWLGRASGFRREALEEYAGGYQGHGALARISRRWTSAASWLILAALLVAFLFVSSGEVRTLLEPWLPALGRVAKPHG